MQGYSSPYHRKAIQVAAEVDGEAYHPLDNVLGVVVIYGVLDGYPQKRVGIGVEFLFQQKFFLLSHCNELPFDCISLIKRMRRAFFCS